MRLKSVILKMKDFNILAIDGGGSRGIMEVAILQDLMNTTTKLRDVPEEILNIIQEDSVSLFSKKESRESFSQLIEGVENPLHPTDVFDMISCTSTGALIGFSMVGGKEDPETGKRLPMTLPELIDFYFELTPKVFQAFEGIKAHVNGVAKTIMGSQIDPFDNTPLLNILKKYFGNSTLQDFDDKCVALTPARRMEHNSDTHYDSIEVFDTKSYSSIKVTDVLMATTNVPIYFKTPWTIRGIPYVDGGLGANCSLGVAIPRMKEITNGEFQSALSVAPSRRLVKKEPNGLKFWMAYFPRRNLDGFHHYMEAKAQYPPGHFMRLWPKSELLSKFETDDLRLTEMKDAVEQEKLQYPNYLQDIIVSALVIAARVPSQDVKNLFQAAKVVMDWSIKSKNAEKALYIARAFAKMPTEDEIIKAESLYYIASSYFALNMFAQAAEEFKKLLEHFSSLNINIETESDVKFWILKGKLNYHSGNFEEAEKDLLHAKSIEETPENNLYLSKVLAAMGKKSEALEIVVNASLDEDVKLTLTKVEMLIENGNIDEALEILIKVMPGYYSQTMAKTASLTGTCHFLKGNIEESLIEHKKAIKYWNGILDREEDPEMIQTYIDAGMVFKQVSQVHKAVELLEKAFSLSMKMYKGTDMLMATWLDNLARVIEEARIDAKAEPEEIEVTEAKPITNKNPIKFAVGAVGTIAGASGKVMGGAHSMIKGLLKK